MTKALSVLLSRFISLWRLYQSAITTLLVNCFRFLWGGGEFEPIENLLPFKDRVPAHICSSVVYEFMCISCQATYYGKKPRHFIVRCREHLGINKEGISIKGASSSIREHINETGHAASIDDFCILEKASNKFDLLIHDSLLISRDRPTINQQNSSIPLYLF